MSLVSDYFSEVKPAMENAVASAMYQMVEPLKQKIDEISGEYDGEHSRPRLFGHGDYTDTITNDSITIMNVTPMQGTWYNVLEADFVEEGLANYNMPEPRPFMERAGEEFVNGEGSAILQQYLD